MCQSDSRLVPVMTKMASGFPISFIGTYMPSKLVKYRLSAYASQGCRCYYCNAPMWERNRDGYARAQALTIAESQKFKSTAEHLKAKVVGGKDTRENIAAACLWCNSRRHRRKHALSPSSFKKLVQRRIRRGRWHSTYPRNPYIEIVTS